MRHFTKKSASWRWICYDVKLWVKILGTGARASPPCLRWASNVVLGRCTWGVGAGALLVQRTLLGMVRGGFDSCRDRQATALVPQQHAPGSCGAPSAGAGRLLEPRALWQMERHLQLGKKHSHSAKILTRGFLRNSLPQPLIRVNSVCKYNFLQLKRYSFSRLPEDEELCTVFFSLQQNPSFWVTSFQCCNPSQI